MRKLLLLLTTAVVLLSCSQHSKTSISIDGEKFCINSEPTFKGKSWRGHSIEGLLPNSRMVNGIFDDKTDSTRYRWVYPDTGVWDAERNVNEFIENMALWRENGLLAFTINLQGGSPQGYNIGKTWWENSAINHDGSLDEAFMGRLERVLDRADELGMVAIVGLYYFGQEQYIDDEAAVLAGIKNSIEWILERGYTNVLIEINNECNYYHKHTILRPERVHECIAYAKKVEVDGRKLLISTSYGGGHTPSNEVAAEADFILLHGNGPKGTERIIEMIDITRNLDGYTPKPIMINEDDHFDFDQPMNNFVAATSVGVSWGYFDYRKRGEPFEVGYQCIPADWGINTDRKRGFFALVNEWGK